MKNLAINPQQAEAMARKRKKKIKHEEMLREHAIQREMKEKEKQERMNPQNIDNKNIEQRSKVAEMKKLQKEQNRIKAEKALEVKKQKDALRLKKHQEMLVKHAAQRKLKVEKKAMHLALEAKRLALKKMKKGISKEEQLENEKKMQAHAIIRHRHEVDISFDLASIEKLLRDELTQYGEIESIKKSIKGGIVVRFKTPAAAQKLLTNYQDKTKPARLKFPIIPVVIKQHCIYFKPTEKNNWMINRDMLHATKQYFASRVSSVQQVRKMRESILVVFHNQEVRDEMLQNHPLPLEILGAHIGPCSSGLPPAVNKKRVKLQVSQKPKVKNIVNEAN